MDRRTFLKSTLAILALNFAQKATALSSDNYISSEKLKELGEHQELVVAYNDGKTLTYKGSGIKPVFDHLAHYNFKNAYVYDKITGKASALLLAYGKCKKLYTKTLSKQAIPILEKYNIEYSADNTIDYIKTTRNPSGRCIMETAVHDINDAKIAYKVLKAKVESLSGK